MFSLKQQLLSKADSSIQGNTKELTLSLNAYYQSVSV